MLRALLNSINTLRPLQVTVWFLVHDPHQIKTTASFHHYWHCPCTVMSFAILHMQLIFKGFISTLLVSLTLPDPILGVSYIN